MPKSIQYVIFGILCCIVVLLGLLLLNATKNYKSVQHDCKYMFKTEEESRSQIYASDLVDFLDAIEYPLPIDNSLYVIIPPFPCEGCLDIQTELIIASIEGDESLRAHFIVPKTRERDFRVKISSNRSKTTIFGYLDNHSVFDNNALMHFDGVVLLTKKTNNIIDVFVASKSFPDLSGVFIERLKSPRQ